MISFYMLPTLLRAFFALWALLLCLMNIGSAVLATVKKRYVFSAFAIILFIPSYFLWQIIFDISLSFENEKITAQSLVIGELNVIYWLILFIVLTAATALLFAFNLRYDKTFITPGTIKLYLDKIPCGICCYRENGRVLFSNNCINELCVNITNNPLLNGNQFFKAVPNEILTVGDKVWRFSHREILLDGERLFEIIASDITAEYAKTEALEADKAELSRLNRELTEYYLSIDESVKHQEILQAKMNIHDEMNRLMLSTMAIDKDDTESLDRIFSLWEQNALLLCMEAEKKADSQKTDAIDSLSSALGINLVWRESLPKNLTEKEKELFFFTAQEALINAVKHAEAKTMEISFEFEENALNCRLKNDGNLPSGEVQFEGGLANLEYLSKKQGAEIFIETKDAFSLILRLKK